MSKGHKTDSLMTHEERGIIIPLHLLTMPVQPWLVLAFCCQAMLLAHAQPATKQHPLGAFSAKVPPRCEVPDHVKPGGWTGICSWWTAWCFWQSIPSLICPGPSGLQLQQKASTVLCHWVPSANSVKVIVVTYSANALCLTAIQRKKLALCKNSGEDCI